MRRVSLSHRSAFAAALVFWSASVCFAQAGAAEHAITGSERITWTTYSTIGPPNLAAGLFSAGFGTLLNRPESYGPHWEGFGKRYGQRLAGNAASNTMEAGIGALWGEDPRYRREGKGGFGHRITFATKGAFTARNRDGNIVPAYARYIAIPGSNFLSNTWRPDQEATASQAMMRTGFGFSGRVVANVFWEFWPDIKKMSLHKK